MCVLKERKEKIESKKNHICILGEFWRRPTKTTSLVASRHWWNWINSKIRSQWTKMHSLDRDRIFCHSDYSVETIEDLNFSFHIQTIIRWIVTFFHILTKSMVSPIKNFKNQEAWKSITPNYNLGPYF